LIESSMIFDYKYKNYRVDIVHLITNTITITIGIILLDFVNNILDCCCPKLDARLEDNGIRQVLTSTHLRELKNVEQSTKIQFIREQGLSRTASVLRREYQRLLRTIGSTGG